MSNDVNTLYIVDGNYIVYRSHFALINLKNSKGMHTGAVYGFCKTIFKLINDKKPSYLIIAFDSKEKTFRDHLFTDYKINRPPMPVEIIEQVPVIFDLLRRLNIQYLLRPGFEADDIIGSAVMTAKKIGMDSCIVTRDKDIMQLIDEKTSIIYPDDTWEEINPDWVYKKFGVLPRQIIDYLSIVGDSSDNVPGIKGIGPKGAQKLLERFSDLEEIYDNLDEIRDRKLALKLKDSKEQAFLSKKLVTIEKDMDLGLDFKKLEIKDLNFANIFDILKELEFYSFLKDINLNKDTENNGNIMIKALKTTEGLENVAEAIRKNGKFSFYPLDDGSITISYGGPDCYISDHDSLGSLFSDPSVMKIAYQIKDILPDAVPENIFDIAIAFSLIDPEMTTSIAFEKLVIKYLNIDIKEDYKGPEMAHYLFELYKIAEVKLRDEGLTEIFYKIEMPLIKIIKSMECNGIMVDVSSLNDLKKAVMEKIRQIEKDIYEIVGFTFNINSTKELQNILFNLLDLKGGKKGKTGYSTSVEVLRELSGTHVLPNKIIEYRQLTKLINTYINVLPGLVNTETNRIHTHFNQTNIITGRLSSDNPNIQAIPKKGEFGHRIRNAFIAPEGHCLVSADYSQIELRVLAHYSIDPVLCDAFMKDMDIHNLTASTLFAFDESMIDNNMRSVAKAVNFGIIYGITPFGLSKQLNINLKKSRHYINLFFNRFKGVRVFIDQVISNAKKDGFVKTLYGRKRQVPEIRSLNKAIQKSGERIAINTIIQGTAAEIIKIAMLNISRALEDLDARMILQIHDEIISEVREDKVDGFAKLLKQGMVDHFSLNVPLKINIKHGKNWGDI